MSSEGYIRKLLKDGLGEKNLLKLPIYYRLMEPLSEEGLPAPPLVESKFHQTTANTSIPYYKVISKVLLKIPDDKE